MTAVSQSYPNYLGGLNEQPDELIKPGQLVEALNVVPDPTIGLTRRPGFKQLTALSGADPAGTWFDFDLDQHYIGVINPNGRIYVYDENGDARTIKTLDPASDDGAGILPHKKYTLTTNSFIVEDDEGSIINEYDDFTSGVIPYFVHENDTPLKYCVSKNHIVVTNPTIQPVLGAAPVPDNTNRYYSFVTLKVIDVANYNYTFKKFFGNEDGDENIITYNSIADIDLPEVIDINDDYKKDLRQPWNGVTREVTLQPNDPDADPNDTEAAVVKVTFRTNTYTFKSSDGDGNPVRVNHNWDVSVVTSGRGFKKGEIRVTQPGVDDGPDITYVFNITDTKKLTSVDFDTIQISLENKESAEEILDGLAEQFRTVGTGIDIVRVVGNGIYLEDAKPFSVSTNESAVADVMNSQKIGDDKAPIVRVNTVAELPIECYEGFLVQVKNSFDGSNDYYLKYISESTQYEGSNIAYEKADGFWEEVAKPFEPVNPKNYSMPHLITAVEDGQTGEYAFIVSRMIYVPRTAGDISDNPSMFADNAKITAIEYYKNRLFFMTDIGTVVSSRAGEINNLHINTALRTSPIDPIDVPASTSSRVPLHGSAVVNNGMVLFGDTEQYSLTTNGDLLTSDTANVTKIANYTFSPVSYPIYLGTNIGFISSGLTRFYEMTNVYDRGPVDINERSQQIQTMFGRGFNMPVSSREQSQVTIFKRYTDVLNSSGEMMVYRFRQENSQDSSQTSWVRWQLPRGKQVAHVTLPQNKIFVVAVDAAKRCYLWYIDSGSIDGLPASSISVVPRFVDGYTNDEDGEKYETIIQFPTIYSVGRTKMDVTANLTIHRVKLSTAAIGTYDLTIDRKGYDSYKLLVEQTPSDEYKANFPPLYGEKIETVPIYTRNKNLKLTISTDYDAPLTLRSMTWEGDWNRPYYKSV